MNDAFPFSLLLNTSWKWDFFIFFLKKSYLFKNKLPFLPQDKGNITCSYNQVNITNLFFPCNPISFC